MFLYAFSRRTADQVAEVKATWPRTRCFVLVEFARHQEITQQAGADMVVLEGFAPGRLLEMLDRVRMSTAHSSSGDSTAHPKDRTPWGEGSSGRQGRSAFFVIPKPIR